ncbi:MAG: hypothetical protein ABJA70_19320 [Chryseolinea sp.]
MTRRSAWSILLITAFVACDVFDVNKEKMPKYSDNGAGTFGCFANGRLFVNEGEIGYGTGARGEVQHIGDTTGILIYAWNTRNDQNLSMSMYDIGRVVINKAYDISTPGFDLEYSDGADPVPCYYNKSISGTITFSRYEVSGSSRIVAGSFNAKASSDGCGGEVELTQGRFDISEITHQ